MSGKRFQHRNVFSFGVAELFKKPSKAWALCIAAALHHHDLGLAFRLVGLHPKESWRKYLPREIQPR